MRETDIPLQEDNIKFTHLTHVILSTFIQNEFSLKTLKNRWACRRTAFQLILQENIVLYHLFVLKSAGKS